MKFRPQWVFRSTRAYRRFDSTRDSFVSKNAHPACAVLVTTLLEKVDGRLRDQDLDGAWFCLQEAMRLEITQRYLFNFGMPPYSHGLSTAKLVVLFAYAAAMIAFLAIPAFRNWNGR